MIPVCMPSGYLASCHFLGSRDVYAREEVVSSPEYCSESRSRVTSFATTISGLLHAYCAC